MRQQTYPATMDEARHLIESCGCMVLIGTPGDVERLALTQCESVAREQGWQGEWAPQPADCEYVQAQVMLAEARIRDAAATLGRKGGLAGKGSPARRQAAVRAARARWGTGHPQTVRVTSRLFSPDLDTPTARIFWVPAEGGYIHDVTEQPGTSGPQVCEGLGRAGNTLMATPATLGRVVRRELARARASLRRELGRRR
jgi:hypothetical protein